ncbi:MAG: hypothetical protein IH840_01175 [Candidatus Heimdallarchaeota archaeon]|nr:hypothetical protein [Candidatus Heimdallarchaeota archaeon]
MANNLGTETQCVDLLGYLMLLNKIESQLYFHLLQNGEKTVTELKKDIDRTQSTTHVALQSLWEKKLITKSKRGRKPNKGYEYIYTAVSPQEVKEIMMERIEEISITMKKCIETFDSDSLLCELVFEK